MIDLETAKEMVISQANNDYGKKHQIEYILDIQKPIITSEKCWFIPFIEKELEKRLDWMGAWKGYLVHKETGELFQPGSGHGIDYWIWGFENGFLGEFNLNLIIVKINNYVRTISALLELNMTYIIPEPEGDIIWKIPKAISEAMIKEKISTLPCRFESQRFSHRLDVFKKIITNKYFDFKIEKVV